MAVASVWASRVSMFVVLCMVAGMVLPAGVARASSGDVGWTRQFGTDGSEFSNEVAVAGDGSVYVVGSTTGDLEGVSAGAPDAFVRKYNANGGVAWTRQFGTSAGDFANAVAVAGDGSVYVVGSTAGDLAGSAGSTDAFVRRYAADGSVVWTRQFGTDMFDAANGVAVAGDGGVYVVGYTNGDLEDDPSPATDAFVRKYNADGGVVWTRQFTSEPTGVLNPENDVATGVAVAVDGSVYVVGLTFGVFPGQSSAGLWDAFVRKYDEDGGVVWTRQFGAANDDEGRGVTVAGDGSVYVAGVIWAGALEGTSAGGADAFVRKYTANGGVVWTRQFGTTASDVANGVAVAGDGSVYVAGSTGGDLAGSVGSTDAFVRRYDTAGNVVWTRQLGTSASDSVRGVAVAGDGSVHVAGFTFGDLAGTSAGGFDGFVRTYAPPPSVVRYAGGNRFETAVEISLGDFADAVPVSTVFVAVGSNFPDALAGAAAAGRTAAPMLLVNTDSIPQATEDELNRLAPDLIVILGGEAVISAAVEAALGAYAPMVTRLAGPNRYATAVAISQWAFPDPSMVEEVVVATGANFPDALGGGPVAVAVGGPVLLVLPTGPLPAVVKDELQRLAPARITVLGGSAAVSDGVVGELATIAPTSRVAGPNRYATAVEASRYAFGSSGRVYVAVGTNFPDALAAAGTAGFYDAPVLLVPTDSLPAEVAAEITRLGAHKVVILGGTSVVSLAVENALKALLGI